MARSYTMLGKLELSSVTDVIKALFSNYAFDEGYPVINGSVYFAVQPSTCLSWATVGDQLASLAEEREFPELGPNLPECSETAGTIIRVSTGLFGHTSVALLQLLETIDWNSPPEIEDVVKLATLLNDGHNLSGYNVIKGRFNSVKIGSEVCLNRH